MGMSQADIVNSIKIWQNLPINNPKPDLYNINVQTKFGENPLMFPETKYGRTDSRTDVRTYGHLLGTTVLIFRLKIPNEA